MGGALFALHTAIKGITGTAGETQFLINREYDVRNCNIGSIAGQLVTATGPPGTFHEFVAAQFAEELLEIFLADVLTFGDFR